MPHQRLPIQTVHEQRPKYSLSATESREIGSLIARELVEIALASERFGLFYFKDIVLRFICQMHNNVQAGISPEQSTDDCSTVVDQSEGYYSAVAIKPSIELSDADASLVSCESGRK